MDCCNLLLQIFVCVNVATGSWSSNSINNKSNSSSNNNSSRIDRIVNWEFALRMLDDLDSDLERGEKGD